MDRSDTKLVAELAERIQEKIARGDLQLGARLRQEALANEFGVSRTPIREALRQLEAKGVVSHSHRRSAVVRAPSLREIREIYQIRAELEGLGAQLAAQWISDEQLSRLEAVHREFVRAVELLEKYRTPRRPRRPREKGDGRTAALSRAWIETNARFHSLIHEASNNLSLGKLIGDLILGYTRWVMRSSVIGMDLHRMKKNITDHEKILYALRSRAPQEARQAMVSHIREAGEFLVTWFENQDQTPQL